MRRKNLLARLSGLYAISMPNFPQHLRAARLAARLTQAEAAKRAGIHQSAWARYESGGRQPAIDQAERLAKAVKKRLAELLK